jgi:superoxide reductase
MGKVNSGGAPMVCCGEEMEQLIPNTTDAAGEKHVPVMSVDGDTVTVTVGSVEHPMVQEHAIQWVYLETERGGQRKSLAPGEAPQVKFALVDDKAVGVFAYCNLHGLWKS